MLMDCPQSRPQNILIVNGINSCVCCNLRCLMIQLLRYILLQASFSNRKTMMMSGFTWRSNVINSFSFHPFRRKGAIHPENCAAVRCSLLTNMHQQFLLRTNPYSLRSKRKYTTIRCYDAATSCPSHTKQASNSTDIGHLSSFRTEKDVKYTATQFLLHLSTTLQKTIFPQIFNFSALSTTVDQPLVILLGVSGGSDSVALLHGLLKLSSIDGSVFPSNPYPYRTFTPLTKKTAHQQSQIADGNKTVTCIPIELHVVHFDHQQREKASDQDRQFVQDLCQQNRVPFHCYYWKDHINTEAGTHNCGSKPFTQDIAREWRRSTMVHLLHQLVDDEHNSSPEGKDTTQEPHKGPNHFTKLGVIMTAHHLNDSEETILLKLLRGVHISRLQGIEAVSSSVFSQKPVLFARPLIQLRKEDIKEYLIVNQLCWREDSSNEEPKYLRNRIRNELIPLLEDLVGGRGNLQKRIENLEEQSLKVHLDISTRVEMYLTQSGTNSSAFVLPRMFHPRRHQNQGTTSNTEFQLMHEFGLVQEEALHYWVQSQMGYHHTFSYQQLQRVCSQLRLYPSTTLWSLDVGNGWTVSRHRGMIVVDKPTVL